MMKSATTFNPALPLPEFPEPTPVRPPWLRPKLLIHIIACALIVFAATVMPTSLTMDGRITIGVFIVSIWLWIFSPIADTYVALGAGTVLVLTQVIDTMDLFAPLGHDTTWMLIGAFIISAAVTGSGIAPRLSAWLCKDLPSPRALVHVLTLALVCTAFMVPATSGRAALVLPVFVALAAALKHQRWLVVALSLIIPCVVLLSAVASFIGAGAHLITDQILVESGYSGISFSQWMLLGLPLALASSHISAEVLLRLMSTREQRSEKLALSAAALPAPEPLTATQTRTLGVLIIAIIAWFTEGLHQIPPALVAVLGALLITANGVSNTGINQAIKKVPWSLLLFMTATVAIAKALQSSGAAESIAQAAFGALPEGFNPVVMFVIAVIVISTVAHLAIQSRSARSAVLIPIVITLAVPLGINPVAVAFISTAAAGFCHTLPASAKPLSIYFQVEDLPHFSTKQLLQSSAILAPIHILILIIFAFGIWPHMGLPLTF